MRYLLFPFRGLWSLSDSFLELDHSPAFSRLVGPAVLCGWQPLVQYHCSHCLPPACPLCRSQSWECDSRTDSNKKWLWNKCQKLNFGNKFKLTILFIYERVKQNYAVPKIELSVTRTRAVSEIKMFNLHINFITPYHRLNYSCLVLT